MQVMGNVDVDKLREERDARLNPPEFEPGMDDDWGDIFNDIDLNDTGSSSLGGDSWSGGAGNQQGMMGNQTVVQQNQNNGMPKSQDEAIFDTIASAGKLAYKGTAKLLDIIKFIFDSIFKSKGTIDPLFWATYGTKLIMFGIGIGVSGVACALIGVLTNYFSDGGWLIVSGCMLSMIGLVIFGNNNDKAKKIAKVIKEQANNSYEDNDNMLDTSNSSEEINDSSSDWDNFDSEEDEVEDGVDDIWSNINDFEYDESEVEEEVDSEVVNVDEVIDSIRDIPAHTYTRQYLFEEYSKILPKVRPDFCNMVNISEDSGEFLLLEKVFRDACIQTGVKEDDIPELYEVNENSLIVQLRAQRIKGLKEQDIADEIATIYSRDEYGRVITEGVYATTSSVGSNFIINIFKGGESTIVVSLADTYTQCSDYIKDSSVGMPVVVGIDEFGTVRKVDFWDVESLLISGKNRSGKSWMAKAIIAQLAMFNSPREVNFEILDTKYKTSDYWVMKDYIPHINRFEGTPKGILKRLRYLTTTERDRRASILADNGVQSIKDLKSSGSDVELPFIYIVVDEMAALRSEMNEDEVKEFRNLLDTITTKTANLGYRLMVIPHRVINDIVSKTTSSMVSFMACVRAEFNDIKTVMGVTKKDFPYNISGRGDMALKCPEIGRGAVVFNHGIGLAKDNGDITNIYKFIGAVWNKLEPNYGVKEEEKKESKEVYKGSDIPLESTEEAVFDLFEDDKDGIGKDDFWNDILDS